MGRFSIEKYSFGSIRINGETYRKDIIITPEKILPEWWRKQGHSLSIDDLTEVLGDPPELLIVGCGSNGMMKVPEDTLANLTEKGIEVICQPTGDAVRSYNENASSGRRISAALHLTC